MPFQPGQRPQHQLPARIDAALMAHSLVAALCHGQPIELADGACSPGSHDLGQGPGAAERALTALRTCGVCPVRAACSAWAAGLPPQHRRSVVLAGELFGGQGRAVPVERLTMMVGESLKPRAAA